MAQCSHCLKRACVHLPLLLLLLLMPRLPLIMWKPPLLHSTPSQRQLMLARSYEILPSKRVQRSVMSFDDCAKFFKGKVGGTRFSGPFLYVSPNAVCSYSRHEIECWIMHGRFPDQPDSIRTRRKISALLRSIQCLEDPLLPFSFSHYFSSSHSYHF